MAFEDDAVQVERLALEPAHAGPAFHQRGDHRELVVGRPGTHAQAPVVLDRQQVHHHGEARAVDAGVGFLGQLARAVAPGQVVDATEVDTGFQSAGRLRCAAWCRRRTIVPQALRASARPAPRSARYPRRGWSANGLQGFEPGHHLVRLGEPLRCFAGLAARPAALRESSARNRVGQTDLVLHLQQAVHQRLGRGRAARHVDVYRYDAVAAADHRIR